MHRARIVSEPLSGYQRWSFSIAYPVVEAGESGHQSGQNEDDGVQGQPHGRPHYRAVDANVLQIAP